MLGRSSAWGIDVGESTIRAVKLSAEKGQARVVALDVVRRPRGPGAGGYVDRNEQLRAAITQLLSQCAIGREAVAISPPGAGFDRFIQLPPVEKKRIPQIVSFEARQQIPFPLEQVTWDYQPVTENPAPGQEIEVGLFAFRSEVIETFLMNIDQCRLGVDLVGMGRLALYNFIMYDRPPTTGTMVVDFGASTTDVIIMHAGNFRVRSIPFAGDTITKALQNKFGISMEEAEDLKRKAGQAGQGRQVEKLLSVMRPTLDKIIGQVVQTVGFFRSQFKELQIEECWLVGDGFNLGAAEGLFREALDCPVHRLGDLNNVALGEEALTSPYRNDLASFATAMGLALQAMSLGPVKINLLPGEMLAQREISRKKPATIAALVAIGLTLGGLQYTQKRAAEAWPKRAREVENLISEVETDKSKRSKLENLSLVEQRRKEIVEIGEGRLIAMDAMNDLAKVFGAVPESTKGRGIYLTSLKVATINRALAGAPIRAVETGYIPLEQAELKFELTGECDRDFDYFNTQLVARLNQHFDNVEVTGIEQKRDEGAVVAVEVPGGEEAPLGENPDEDAEPDEAAPDEFEFTVEWKIPFVPQAAGDAPGEPGAGGTGGGN